jgi:peroxiredoxin
MGIQKVLKIIFQNKNLIGLLVLVTLSAANGQQFFRFSGEIKNPEEKTVAFTLYKNWVEPPTEYTLKLNAKNQFSMEIPLNEIAYCDLNMGSEGFYALIIEPSDKIEMQVDALNFSESLKISGEGSGKWTYYLEKRQYFEIKKDWELELENLKKISKKGYFELTAYLNNELIKKLNTYKAKISEEFYSLERADIYGKMSNYELQYLVSQKMFNQQEFERFELKTFNPKIQNKSFEFGNFVESLLENHNLTLQKNAGSNLSEIEYLKSYFEKLASVDKPMIERLMATKIMSYLDTTGPTEENKLMVASFKEFSKNLTYTNALVLKLNKLQNLKIGREAKNFVLINEKNNQVALKDFRGKYVLLSFFASWCGPCLTDITYLKIVDNYFKSNNNLAFISISTDSPEDFHTFLAEKPEIPGSILNAQPSSNIYQHYFLENLPTFLLIDKSGTIISEEVIAPSEDEGRALIKQIERLIDKK